MRSTKGQHKAHDQLEQPAGPKKRGRKPKKTEDKQEEPEEEIIRCVCGATEQDEDSGEPWIACDKCTAWQHNVCMGMSIFGEDLPKEYFCEQCKPEDHKELLEGMARGEKPWEDRRRAYEEEKASEKKKKGGKKGKGGKRNSDPKDEMTQGTPKPKASPAPEPKKETKAAAGTKRKSRAASEEKEPKVRHADASAHTPSSSPHANPFPPWQGAQKLRKVSETQAVPVPVPYNPPPDIPNKISELLDSRLSSATALNKALLVGIGMAEKKHGYVSSDGVSNEAKAERFALQVERAVHDSHPNHKEYATQVRTLNYNLKHNGELSYRLLMGTLTPPMLAVMKSDELATKEQQREAAEMKAKAEKQSILTTDDNAPRVRRTHKGEEIVESDNFTVPSEDKPSAIRRQSVREAQEPKAEDETAQPELPADIDTRRSPAEEGLHIDTQQSPKTDFDINKVFSSVRSPTAAHQRRPSQPVPTSSGPGVDPEVDRLLDDREESPPYSPSEETDPNIVWRGNIVMNSVANFQATAKHAGGVNLSATINLPWATLIPKRLTVAGRIDEQRATEYLCSLRYSAPTDITVAALSPATEASQTEFYALIEYFVSKKRYGVVGDKGVGNVRDTYLIPVPPGTGNHPEFMLNLEDNFIPQTRTEPMLLLVLVYRNDPAAMEKLHGPNWAAAQQASPVAGTPTPAAPPSSMPQRTPSIGPPAFSPTSPQGAFPAAGYPPARNSQTPSQPARQQVVPPGYPATPGPPQQHMSAGVDAANDIRNKEGEALARQILGPLINSSTISFILPQAAMMKSQEWMLIKDIYEREPRARDDLQCLSALIEMASKGQGPPPAPPPPPQAQQQQPQQLQQNHPPPPPLPPQQQQVVVPPPAPPAVAAAAAAAPRTSQTPVPIPQIPHSVPPPRQTQVHPPPAVPAGPPA